MKNFIKKISILILIITISFSLTSCSLVEGLLKKEESEISTEWTYNSNNHWHEETKNGEVIGKADESFHLFSWTTTKESTCLEKGHKVYKCSVCGYIKEETDLDKLDHEYTNTSYSWNGKTCTAQASCSLCNSNITESVSAVLSTEGKIEATITTNRFDEYKAEFTNKAFETQYKNFEVDNSKLEKNYTFKNFIWNTDDYTAKAVYSYNNSDTDVKRYDAVISQVKVDATCESDGSITYTATYDGHADTKIVPLNKINHNWDTISYTWNNKTCTAIKACKNDSTHSITETITATLSTEGKIAATNSTNRFDEYKAEFTNIEFETQYKNFEVEGTMLVDGYQFSKFEWNTDTYTADAIYSLLSNPASIQTYTATITNVKIDATCEKDGSITYTATYDGHTDTKVVPLNKTNHDYEFIEFIWDDTNHTAQAKYVCKNDNSHIGLYDATMEYTNKANMCGSSDVTITAIAKYEYHTSVEKEFHLNLSSISHNYQFYKYEWNDAHTECKYINKCANCYKLNTVATAKTANEDTKSNIRSEVIQIATCTQTGIVKYTATFISNKKTIGTTYIEIESEKDLTNHNYGSWINGVDATEEKDGTKGHYHCDLCGKNFDASYNEIASLILKYSELDTVETNTNNFAATTLDYVPTYITDYLPTATLFSSISCTQTFNINTIYNGYYSGGLTWTNQTDLRRKLNELITSNYNKLEYNGNWESNTYADQSLYASEFVDVVYSTSDVYTERTGTGWQREHAWCASLMTGQLTSEAVKTKGRATDFHNLFAAYSSGNTSRGNKSFGDADSSSNKYNIVKNGDVVQYEYDANAFEPSDNDKGRLARAIFYMAIMYMDRTWLDDLSGKTYNTIDGLPGLVVVNGNLAAYDSTNSDTYYKMGHFEDLIEWALYSVDRVEYQHNEMVYGHKLDGKTAQGNRNPFVDFPELVKYAFDEDYANVGGTLTDLTPSYNSLFLDSDTVYCYQIKNGNYQINQTEEITKEDFTVYAISSFTGDYTTSIYKHEEVTNYTLGNLNRENKFNTYGLNELEFEFADSKTTTLNVLYKSRLLQESSFNADILKSSLTGITSNTNNEITLNGTSWILFVEKNAEDSTLARGSLGTQFGSTSKPVSKVVLTSKYNFNCDEKNLINAVYFKASTASGSSYKITINIKNASGDIIKTTGELDLAYTNGEIPELISLEDAGSIKGIIEITITNVTSALLIHSIGVDLS